MAISIGERVGTAALTWLSMYRRPMVAASVLLGAGAWLFNRRRKGENMRGLEGEKSIAKNGATSRNTDHAQSRTPSSDRLDDAMNGRSRNKSNVSAMPENDRDAQTSEGNGRAFSGLHTEEKPKSKGKKGKRLSTARSRKGSSRHV